MCVCYFLVGQQCSDKKITGPSFHLQVWEMGVKEVLIRNKSSKLWAIKNFSLINRVTIGIGLDPIKAT